MNLQLSSAGIRFWSGAPEGEITAAHDSGQVLMFQGKIGPDSGSGSILVKAHQ